MDETQDFKSLQEEIQSALVATTRTTGQISTEDLGFQRSLSSDVGTALDEQSQRVLALASALLKSAASISDLKAPLLEDADDVENNWRGVVDVVDSLLEKADTSLDEYTGVIKRRDPKDTEPVTSKSKKQLGNAFRNQNLVKPQLAFDIKPDNEITSPWKPLLTTKPHAIQSLEDSLGIFTNEFDQKQYRHPYETEILQLRYPDSVYTKADPIPYLPVETTSAIFVDTEEGVLEMLEELKTATEIAVDLEHHDTRSYVGLVSLMQISTRHKDWIVDTLKPWRHRLQVLNEVFADPNILKVFHGAFMDIVWLQRDLGLYVVGLFDTHYASKSLHYGGGSLAFLLKKFINFDADKKYQLADWRIRPLPEEMFFYARADTHFLLYIYDMMRNELVDNTNAAIPELNLMEHVLQKSKETSLLRYERAVYNAETGKGAGGWYGLLTKTLAMLDKEQFSVFRAVHEWRDQIARKDDDSTFFVMPNHVIVSLAKLMPMDMVALLRIVHPISHSVKSRSGELLELIKSAKARGKDGPSMINILKPDSVGAIKANLSASNKTPSPVLLAAKVDESELRTDISNFWGGAFGSSVWDSSKPTTPNDGMKLAIPMPALSSEIFVESPSLNPQSLADRRRDIEKSLESPSVKPASQIEQNEEPFVIKRGAKRKSDAVTEPEPEPETPEEDTQMGEPEQEEQTGEYDISLDAPNSEAERRRLKKERKREKKRLKAEKKAAEIGEEEADEDDTPFDYSKAEPVLHAKPKKEKKGGKEKKPFDPYAKSADAGKGMRRVQSERAGRSATFKN